MNVYTSLGSILKTVLETDNEEFFYATKCHLSDLWEDDKLSNK